MGRSIKIVGALAVIILSAGILAGCGPKAVTGLAATGSLGQIDLTWDKVDGAVGYNVYRRAAETALEKLNSTPLTDTQYSDTISSDGDGVFYYYVVKSISNKGVEDAESSEVRCMHGTRLGGSIEGTLDSNLSPFVVDPGTELEVTGPKLLISNCALYVLEGSTIRLRWGTSAPELSVDYGTLDVMGTAADPVLISVYSDEGSLDPNAYLMLRVWGNADQSTAFRFARVDRIGQTTFGYSPVTFENCYLFGTESGPSLDFLYNSAAIVNCRLEDLGLSFGGPYNTGSGVIAVRNNLVSCPTCSLSLGSMRYDHLQEGDIGNNCFDIGYIILQASLMETGDLCLMGNYWSAEPTLTNLTESERVGICVDPVLTEPPTNAGPSW